MADDSVSQPASDQTAGQPSEAINQPPQASDLSAPAAESTSLPAEAQAKEGSQPEQDQPPQAPEPEAISVPQSPPAPQAPKEETISMSTPPQTEPSGNTPSAQDMPPETEPTKIENQPMQADTEPQKESEAEAVLPQSQETSPSLSLFLPFIFRSTRTIPLLLPSALNHQTRTSKRNIMNGELLVTTVLISGYRKERKSWRVTKALLPKPETMEILGYPSQSSTLGERVSILISNHSAFWSTITLPKPKSSGYPAEPDS